MQINKQGTWAGGMGKKIPKLKTYGPWHQARGNDLGVQPKQNSITAPNQILTQQSNCQDQSDEKVRITELGKGGERNWKLLCMYFWKFLDCATA